MIETFVLVEFEKKKSVLYYVGKVLKKYSPIEYKISFLRKKPNTLKFVFLQPKMKQRLDISDVVAILTLSNTGSTARTADIFSFQKSLSIFNFG